MSDTSTARDVSEAQFPTAVLEASHQRGVVVDFWAPWCGPCHQLSPILERVAARYAGDVDLVKVNVDEAPSLARQYRVQGIPAVKGIRDGTVVAELTGVQPEQVIDQLFSSLAPSEADRLAERAETESGLERERLARAALGVDAGHGRATVLLARLLVDRGEVDEARALLARVPGDAEARRLAAELELGTSGEEDLDEVRAAADAGDAQAALRLGRALAARGEYAEALERLQEAVRSKPVRDEAREAVLQVFEVLGQDHELVRAHRPKLAAALF